MVRTHKGLLSLSGTKKSAAPAEQFMDVCPKGEDAHHRLEESQNSAEEVQENSLIMGLSVRVMTDFDLVSPPMVNW